MGPTEYTVVTGDLVNVFITSNVASFTSEKRFDKSLSVAELKSKLEMITGGSASTMKISAFTKEDKFICKLEDNNALLGSHPIDDGCRLHIQDETRAVGEFENTAGVEKFELSKEEYNAKEDTVAAFLKRNKLGKYNEEEMAELARQKEERETGEQLAAEQGGMQPGARCEVSGEIFVDGCVFDNFLN